MPSVRFAQTAAITSTQQHAPGGFGDQEAQTRSFRQTSFPLHHSSRRKPRRWPLALRFIKGSIHMTIFPSVVFFTLYTALITYIDQSMDISLGISSSITPALSIVVGLLLVFRNSSSYDRFWGGRQDLSHVVCSVRNLARIFMVCGPDETEEDRAEKEKVIKCLIALMYAIKTSLRSEWGVVAQRSDEEFSALLPQGFEGHEEYGVSIPVELGFVVEKYIRDGFKRGFFHAPQAAMLSSQLNSIIDLYGHMETIKLTPIPVCYQIHQKQVLSLYCLFLPFAIVDEMGWITVPILALVSFTLFGIEGIGQEMENPFGYDKNDIKMELIIWDLREEVLTLLDAWKKGKDDHFI